jgi:5-methyltetrahydropteroyltriglutamate--homocysteine methyltransferase
VVNPRTETIESLETISAAIEQALQLYPADQLFLNPDCGFGTFSNRPVNSSEIAYEKLRAIVDAAQAWRARIRLL